MKGLTESVIAADKTADRNRMFIGVLVIGALFGFGSTAQTMMMFESTPMTINGVIMHPAAEATLRITLNLVTVIFLAAAASWLRLHDLRYLVALPVALLLAATVALLRAVLQMLFGVFQWGTDSPALLGMLIVVPVAFMIIVIGLVIVALGRQARNADRARLEASVRAGLALEELQQEELRVRREVADALHGTMQHHVVLLESSVRAAAERLKSQVERAELREISESLTSVADQLNDLREHELRQLSAAIYPEALDRGLVPATRALVARIPRTIPVRFTADGVATPDALDRGARLLMVRVAEEGISNALRHGRASRIELLLAEHDGAYLVEVRHAGLVPPENPVLSGLDRLRARLAEHGGELELIAEFDGAVLRASMPLPAEPRRS